MRLVEPEIRRGDIFSAETDRILGRCSDGCRLETDSELIGIESMHFIVFLSNQSEVLLAFR
jgi:hypothetical protein